MQDVLPVVDIADIETIEKAVYEKGLKLVNVLEFLGCPYAKLHNASNDVTFALGLLLVLVIKTQLAGLQHWLSRFQKIFLRQLKLRIF